MVESKLKYLSSKAKQFYFWKWAIPINLLFYLVLFITQVILLFVFGFTVLVPRNGSNYYYYLIIIQTLAGTISIIATIYTIRLERKFFYFNSISMVLFVFNNVMLGMYINAFKAFLLWFPLIVRYGRWSQKQGRGLANKIPRRLRFRYFISLAVVYFGLAYGLSLLLTFDSYPLAGSIALVFSLGGASLQMFGYIEGFMFALLTSTMTIFMFSSSHAYTAVLTSMVFITATLGTIFAWLAIYHETYGTFRYVKPDKSLILINKIIPKYID